MAECTSPLTRQAVRLRRFESSTLRNFIQNMEQTTIESRVASAILERNVGNIEIEGVTYEIAPPSIATLIVVSEFIASLPIVEKVEKTEIVNSVLHHARFFRPLGDIAASIVIRSFGCATTSIEQIQASLNKMNMENYTIKV